MFGKRLSRALAVTTVASLVMATAVFADNLQNDATSDGNNVITAGGSTTITYRLVGNSAPGGDIGGCNVDTSNKATLIVAAPAGVTATPTSVDFVACGNSGEQTVVFSSNTPGSYSITHAISGGRSGALYANHADFTLTVNAGTVTNSPPEISSATFAANVNCRVTSTLNVSFTDADSGDTHVATVDWGDGSNPENLGIVASPFAATHVYTSAGGYTATVTVSDGIDSDSAFATITVLQTYTTSFLAPLDGSSPSKLIANTMKKGRVVPVKVTIYDDCAEAWVNDPITNVAIDVKTATFTANSTDAVETFSDAGASSNLSTAFRFSADSSMASGGFWIYNLDTNGLTIGTQYQVAPKIGSVLANSTYAILKPTK